MEFGIPFLENKIRLFNEYLNLSKIKKYKI